MTMIDDHTGIIGIVRDLEDWTRIDHTIIIIHGDVGVEVGVGV